MQKGLQESRNLFLAEETSDQLQLFSLKEQSLDSDVRCHCKYWKTDTDVNDTVSIETLSTLTPISFTRDGPHVCSWDFN
jgi:hypothetical protein